MQAQEQAPIGLLVSQESTLALKSSKNQSIYQSTRGQPWHSNPVKTYHSTNQPEVNPGTQEQKEAPVALPVNQKWTLACKNQKKRIGEMEIVRQGGQLHLLVNGAAGECPMVALFMWCQRLIKQLLYYVHVACIVCLHTPCQIIKPFTMSCSF